MKKSWKCFLGTHDWEPITDRKESRDNDGIGPWIYDQVCIRPGCHKFWLRAAAHAKARLDIADRKRIANEKAKLHISDELVPMANSALIIYK